MKGSSPNVWIVAIRDFASLMSVDSLSGRGFLVLERVQERVESKSASAFQPLFPMRHKISCGTSFNAKISVIEFTAHNDLHQSYSSKGEVIFNEIQFKTI